MNTRFLFVLCIVSVVFSLAFLFRKPIPISPIPQDQSVFVTFHTSPPMKIATPSGSIKGGTPTPKRKTATPEL